jgi:tRNA threonylcarbamoyladenosine biosynthesis protein TsaE
MGCYTARAVDETNPAPMVSVRLDGVDEAMLCGLAERLGAAARAGDVVLLVGEMGAGKTTFTRAFARGLGVARPDRVCSPTFNVRIEHAGPRPLVHVDLCRLVALGPDDDDAGVGAAAFEASVLVVEWAQAWSQPPAQHLRIEIGRTAGLDADRRDVVLLGRGPLALAAEAAVRPI